jgi:hypothetical protein
MGDTLWLRIDDILELLNISRRYLQNLRLRGVFPAPIRRLGKRPVWLAEDVMAWAKGEDIAPKRPARQRRTAGNRLATKRG